MAQRTGADDRLAPRAKATSIAIAMLVAAALAASGCGGDSDDDQTASASGPEAAKGSAQGASSPSSSPPSSAVEGKAGGDTGSQTSPGSSEAGGGKHGQRIVLPKGSPEPGPTPQERAQATVASIALTSPALPTDPSSAATLPSTYTCDGEDESPPLRWTGVPPGTQELALFAMNTQPVNEKLFFDWAVAGIDPTTEELEAGKLPKGAVIGKNDFGKSGYSICPPQGQPETYIFALYAVPEQLNASKGFDPFALRTQILEVSRNVGLLAVSYGR